ncbi:hypothetical protein HN011_002192 [Eciton burchellii]|nr:hypothetical protein HN011_002192 [Eciton burchellii]
MLGRSVQSRSYRAYRTAPEHARQRRPDQNRKSQNMQSCPRQTRARQTRSEQIRSDRPDRTRFDDQNYVYVNMSVLTVYVHLCRLKEESFADIQSRITFDKRSRKKN